MINRDTEILKIRSQNIGDLSEQNSADENFQNQTLRPILKLQNELYISVYIQYCIKNKSIFFKLNAIQKADYIDHSLVKDFKFREFLLGLTVALFSNIEFDYYSLNSSNLNKRIISMLTERLKSNIQVLIQRND